MNEHIRLPVVITFKYFIWKKKLFFSLFTVRPLLLRGVVFEELGHRSRHSKGGIGGIQRKAQTHPWTLQLSLLFPTPKLCIWCYWYLCWWRHQPECRALNQSLHQLLTPRLLLGLTRSHLFNSGEKQSCVCSTDTEKPRAFDCGGENKWSRHLWRAFKVNLDAPRLDGVVPSFPFKSRKCWMAVQPSFYLIDS